MPPGGVRRLWSDWNITPVGAAAEVKIGRGLFLLVLDQRVPFVFVLVFVFVLFVFVLFGVNIAYFSDVCTYLFRYLYYFQGESPVHSSSLH